MRAEYLRDWNNPSIARRARPAPARAMTRDCP